MKRTKHILVVDDNRDAAEMLSQVLRSEQPARFTIDMAFDGQQALDVALVRTPDTVVMDIEIPLLNGLFVALALRSRPNTSRSHLIALSGRTDYIAKVRRSETAFDDGLDKPVDVERLVRLIDAGVASRADPQL